MTINRIYLLLRFFLIFGVIFIIVNSIVNPIESITKIKYLAFILIFLLWLYYRWSSRFNLLFFLALTISIPLFELFNNSIQANNAALWAFYFLALTAFHSTIENLAKVQSKNSKKLFKNDLSLAIPKIKSLIHGLIFEYRGVYVKTFLFILLVFYIISGYMYFLDYFMTSALIIYLRLILSPYLLLSCCLIAISIIIVNFLRQKYTLKISYLAVIILTSIFSHAVIYENTNHFLSNNAIITKVNPKRASMWKEVSIYGKNFGDSQYNGAKVLVNDQEQRVLRWTKSRIIFIVDPNTTKSGTINIVNVDGKKSNHVSFEYIQI